VKVFYVSNRNADQKEATRPNLNALGFPMGGNVDTLLMQKDKPEWSTGAKGSRFAYIAKDYRVLLMFGDQIGGLTVTTSSSRTTRSGARSSVCCCPGRPSHNMAYVGNAVTANRRSHRRL
jgi:acid phosphatase